MNMNSTNITSKQRRYLSLAIACLVSALALTSLWLTPTTRAQSTTVSARTSSVEPAEFCRHHHVFWNGDILAAACQSCPREFLITKRGPQSTRVFQNVSDVAFAQPSISLSTAEQDSVFGGWQNQWRFGKDGTQNWVIPVGCCNSASTPGLWMRPRTRLYGRRRV